MQIPLFSQVYSAWELKKVPPPYLPFSKANNCSLHLILCLLQNVFTGNLFLIRHCANEIWKRHSDSTWSIMKWNQSFMVFFKVEKIKLLICCIWFVLFYLLFYLFAGEDISGIAYFNYVPTRELLVAGKKGLLHCLGNLNLKTVFINIHLSHVISSK